jgi:hypothetical protein
MLAFLSKIVEEKLSSPEPQKFNRLAKLPILIAYVGVPQFSLPPLQRTQGFRSEE